MQCDEGQKNGVIAKLRTLQPWIIDIDCVCHLVSLCVKTATKQLPLKVDELLVDIYYHFSVQCKENIIAARICRLLYDRIQIYPQAL